MFCVGLLRNMYAVLRHLLHGCIGRTHREMIKVAGVIFPRVARERVGARRGEVLQRAAGAVGPVPLQGRRRPQEIGELVGRREGAAVDGQVHGDARHAHRAG